MIGLPDLHQRLSGGDALLEGAALSGRILVQLTTGTPGEAARGAETLRAAGALCLDGVILCYPDGIGTAETRAWSPEMRRHGTPRPRCCAPWRGRRGISVRTSGARLRSILPGCRGSRG
ncbi:MAG: hypothetical protein AAFU49_19395 [Pseudomonadota bacterium]